ncbi:hypothetical protein [Citreimonas sp.]|uniref:hypothetical protein n=1 Tax=Citreimonas sp. TaxID=3036715 RepID=UPI004058FB61
MITKRKFSTPYGDVVIETDLVGYRLAKVLEAIAEKERLGRAPIERDTRDGQQL